MLLQGFWLERRTEPLSIYLPKDGIKPVEELLCAASYVREVVKFPFEFYPLRHEETILVSDVKITPFLNSHFDSFKKQAGEKYTSQYTYESFSFLIQKGDLKIAHSADIGSIKDVETIIKDGVDTLVCELAHIDPIELFELVAGKKLRMLALVHLDGKYRAGIKELLSLAEKMIPDVKLVVPDDGMEIFIERKKAEVK